MGTGMAGKTLWRRKQETIQIHAGKQQTEQRPSVFDRDMAGEEHTEKFVSKGGPPLPVQEAPAKKRLSRSVRSETRQVPAGEEQQTEEQRQESLSRHTSQKQQNKHRSGASRAQQGEMGLGELKEEERTDTYSDVQRKGFKGNLSDCVRIDEKANYSKDFQKLLKLIKEYAGIDATGDMAESGERAVIEKENKLLSRIMTGIEKRWTELEDPKNKDKYQKEREIVKLYKGYFALDTGGYLQVPADVQIQDCQNVQMKMKGKPIPMKTVPKETPLFPHEPSVNDIAQGGVGDCYLLAALAAVVNKNPQWIKDCMKDNGDGSVTVRLYDWMEQNSQGNWIQGSLTPHYIKIAKKVPGKYNGSQEPFAKGSLWVQLIEHAYAVSGMHDRTKEAGDYKSIEGGRSEEFIRRITGRQQENVYTGAEDKNGVQVSKLEGFMQAYERREQEKQSGRKMIDIAAMYKEILKVEADVSGEEGFVLQQAVCTLINFLSKDKTLVDSIEDVKHIFTDDFYKKYRQQELDALEKEIERKSVENSELTENVRKCTMVLNQIQKELGEARKAYEDLRREAEELPDMWKDRQPTEEEEQELSRLKKRVTDARMKMLDIAKPERELDSARKKWTFNTNEMAKMELKKLKLESMRDNGWKTLENEKPDEVDRLIEYERRHYMALRNFYENHGDEVLQHKAFTGNYTESALGVYRKIEEGDRQGKMMAASSVQEFRSKDGDGLNGEDMEEGLVSKHAYTLMGVKELGGHKYVKLRNPWSDTIRSYGQKEDGSITRRQERDGNHGIFLVELNEFMTRFRKFSLGK